MTASRFASLTFAPFIGAVLAISCALLGCNTIFGNELGYLAERDAREEDAFDGVDAKFDNVSVDTASADAVYDATLDGPPIDVPTADAIDVRLGDAGDARPTLDVVDAPPLPDVTADRDAEVDGRPPSADATDGCILNACGGCAVLSGVPGASCGICGTSVCSSDNDSVTCLDPGRNLCDGCGMLDAAPGGTCGSCGKYVCSTDKTRVACDDPGFAKVKQLSAGWSHTCAVLTTGGVRCWGDNGNGQIGDGTTTRRLSPVAVPLPGVASIAAGTSHTCALMITGAVQCWGGNGSGQVGDGTTSQRPSPVATSGLSSGVTAIGVGNWGNSCALLNTGSVSCWGNNVAGQQGDSTTADVYLPTAVPGLGGVSAISVASKYTCALAGAGSVQCWGANTFGQLGDGTTTERHFPVNTGLSGALGISAGDAHTCARVSSGKVQCWGSNLHGGLGDGTNTDSYTPKEVSGMAAVSALTVGADHSCALLPTGTVQCWGLGNHGQLGNGVTSDSLTPLTISGLSDVGDIQAGGYHTCAVLTTGVVKCWGDNFVGQVGDGTQIERHTLFTVPLCP